jgi:tetratricopeptide (TPR) repeat protein
MSGKSSASALILGLGVTAVFSISFLFYTFFWKTKSSQPKILPPPTDVISTTPSTPPAAEQKPEESVNTASAPVPPEVSPPAPTPSPVVVDEEESDDEDEDEEQAAQLALKTSYDDALRLAKKLLAGEKFFKAAEKFTEAIKLAEELGGSASNDITTLYNNRSAMYEKCGELELALTDIGLVLAMEALHLKARVRRARIYEVQNKIKLSCIDYMVAMLIEMTKNQQPSNQEKIEVLVKQQAVSECQAVVDAMRLSSSRDLPSKSHCRNYFESFPSFHKWRAIYATADRDVLAQAVAEAGGDFTEQETCETTTDLASRLSAIHALACFDIVNGAYNKAFASAGNAYTFIQTNKSSLDTDSDADSALSTAIADVVSIHGIELHLRANFSAAKECFVLCLEKQPLPLGFESALRLASVHLEVDAVEDASQVYESIADSFTPEDSADEAWVCIHRMSEWTTRDNAGKFRPQAMEMATATLTRALDLTRDYGEDMIKKACYLMATLKLIQVLSQTKMQMGLQPDNDDLAKQKECIDTATALFPQHETVTMLGVDMLSQEGKFDEALAACDEMLKKSEDGLFIVNKANVLCQMGMTKYGDAQQQQSQQLAMEAGELLQKGQDMYAEAIALEPNCIEALIQLAQLKSMMGAGEMESALALCNQALPSARSRDEALDIMHLKLMMENRLVAFQEMRANGMQV